MRFINGKKLISTRLPWRKSSERGADLIMGAVQRVHATFEHNDTSIPEAGPGVATPFRKLELKRPSPGLHARLVVSFFDL
jgi:hypothetical protein